MIKKGLRSLKKNYFVFLIIFLGFFLRIYHYAQFPIAGETQDEIAWSMLGASLIQTGEPSSWSHFEAYRKNNLNGIITHINEKSDLSTYILVKPVVDHPPLFGLIPGAFHTIKNPWDQIPSIKLIRLPMVMIGTLNLFLLYLVSKKVFKKKSITYLATLIYGIVPSFVLSSRLVVAENLLITWMLLTIYLIKSNFKYKELLLTLISIAAIFTKVSGLVIPLGIAAYAWQMKDRKVIKSGIIGFLIGEVGYFIYGAFLNWDLFLEVNLSQAGRNLGLATLANRLFLNPTIVEKTFFDGWIILGLIALVSLFLIYPKKYLLIKTYFILWMAFIVSTSGESTFHGWYDYPLYPLLAMASAWLINYLYKKRMYWLVWLSWFIVLPTVRLALLFSGQYLRTSNIFIRELILTGAIPLGFSMIKQRSFAKAAMIALGGLLVISSILVVIYINETQYWEMNQYFNQR